jgi:hypothetical protein
MEMAPICTSLDLITKVNEEIVQPHLLEFTIINQGKVM